MGGSPVLAPATASNAGSIRYPFSRLVLAGLAVLAAAAAMVVLATQSTGEMLDYGVGVVPPLVPWVSAWLSVAVALMGLSERRAVSSAMTVLIGGLVIATAWSITMLPFDALRVVQLVPLPLSVPGLVLRLLLLVAAAAALIPVLNFRRAHQERCPSCGRVLPGGLDRVGRWPAVVAVAFALVYPVLRIVWAMGGTFGTTGQPMNLDPAVAWGVVVVGATLVAFTLILLVGRGPTWARALFGLGGLVAGAGLTVTGGLAAVRSAALITNEGLSSSQGDELMTWTFLIVYGSWFVTGLAVIAASWRYWAHRRDGCPTCGPLLKSREDR
jgi:hypothetical protein